MAKLRFVFLLSKTTVAISILNMVFSGGCTPSGSSNNGLDRYETAGGMSRDYPGENAPGSDQLPGGYDDLSEWNFNSRMDRSSSANKNSIARNTNPVLAGNDGYPAQGVELSPSQVNAGAETGVRTYKYHNPADPKADKDGFVTFTVPDDSSFNVEPEVQTPQANNLNNTNTQSNFGQVQPGYYNTTTNNLPANSYYSTGTNSQIQPVVQQNTYQQQPVIQPGRITGITVNGVNDTGSYSPIQSSVPQGNVPGYQAQNSFTVSQGSPGQAVAQKPVAFEAGYALPRINTTGDQQSSGAAINSPVPVRYNSNNNQVKSNPSIVGDVYNPGNSAINNNNAIPAISQYNNQQVSSVDDLTTSLEKLLSKNPNNLDLQMALRYAYAARGDYDRALQELSVIPIDSQRQSIALARATILSSKLETTNDPMTANSALSAIKILQDKVADKADLKISTFKICSKVDNFGQYQEIAPGSLESGNACEVLVYCELENYQYELNDEGKYFTSLHAEISLFDSSLNVLAQISEDVVDTPSFNKRKDFFLRGPFKLPQLRPGKYQIVISMEDKVAGKRALAARYPFEVKGSGISAGTIE